MSIVAQRACETLAELQRAPPCSYAQPREIACFSRRADRSVLLNDRSQLRAFRRPELPVDLNAGFESFVDKPSDAPIGDVLEALAANRVDTSAAQFVTYRNNLNKILYTPYNPREGWSVGVSRSGATVHLHVLESAEQAERERGRSEQDRRMAFWGYAFEAAATAPVAAGGPIDCNAEFCAIAKTTLGGSRIILAGEVDCEREAAEHTAGGMRPYVELKTSKLLTDEHSRRSFERYKLSKWYLQSYLLGVETIFCGFRDHAGVLQKVQELEIKQLPAYARSAWQPHVMLNFGAATLGWLYERVVIGPPSAGYVLSYEPAARRMTLAIAPEGVAPGLAPTGG